MLSGARGKKGRRKPSEMKWYSHCMKSVNIDYVIRIECTFWSCAECGKILGPKMKTREGQKNPEESLKNIVRTTESSSTEGDRADNIHLTGSVKKKKTQRGQKNHIENN